MDRVLTQVLVVCDGCPSRVLSPAHYEDADAVVTAVTAVTGAQVEVQFWDLHYDAFVPMGVARVPFTETLKVKVYPVDEDESKEDRIVERRRVTSSGYESDQDKPVAADPSPTTSLPATLPATAETYDIRDDPLVSKTLRDEADVHRKKYGENFILVKNSSAVADGHDQPPQPPVAPGAPLNYNATVLPPHHGAVAAGSSGDSEAGQIYEV